MKKTKILIVSGFLGSGKTTFIKKFIKDSKDLEKTVIIENEFGEVSIDGEILESEGISVREINSGCICCSLSGNFKDAINDLKKAFDPDTIVIEPSGVAKLSEIVDICQNEPEKFEISQKITIVDPSLYEMYTMNFGEFYIDQVKNSSVILFSRYSKALEEGINFKDIIDDINRKNVDTYIVEMEWDKFDSLDLIYGRIQKDSEMVNPDKDTRSNEDDCGYDEHHHKHDCDEHHHKHDCGEHHHKHDCDEHHHELDCDEHHHKHDCGEHHHKHDCDEHHHELDCGCGEHHHEHDCGCGHSHNKEQDGDFESIAIESKNLYSEESLKELISLFDTRKYGKIIRAKGSVKSEGGNLHFNFVPGEINIEKTDSDRIIFIVIGTELNKNAIQELFS